MPLVAQNLYFMQQVRELATPSPGNNLGAVTEKSPEVYQI